MSGLLSAGPAQDRWAGAFVSAPAGTMRASPSRDAAGRRASMDGFRDWLEGLTARELAVYGVVALALLV
ncbi:MAG TPA: hypothetical protein VF097_08360, partial [Actinomycetota bacterium]